MSLNIQSINAKFNSFTTLIDLINEKNNNTLSAICLQETWLGEADEHSLFIFQIITPYHSQNNVVHMLD